MPVPDPLAPLMASALFSPQPGHWGLRGDPVLWDRMRDALHTTPCPTHPALLHALMADTFRALTGEVLSTTADTIRLEGRLAGIDTAQGGMSTGLASPCFWRDTAIPRLVARLPTHVAKDHPDGL